MKTTSYTSVWKKDGKTCSVHSTRETNAKRAKFTFTGFNPFPCFSMESTYVCVAKWLHENGWQKQVNGSCAFTSDNNTVVIKYVGVKE